MEITLTDFAVATLAGIIASIIASSKGNIYILPIGTMIAIAVQFVILFLELPSIISSHAIQSFKDACFFYNLVT